MKDQPVEAAASARESRIRRLVVEFLQREPVDQASAADRLVADHPDLMPELAVELKKARLIHAARVGVSANRNAAEAQTTGPPAGEQPLSVRCPNCRESVAVVAPSTCVDICCSTCGSRFSLLDRQTATYRQTTVSRIAHYEVKEQVGCGAFGAVWKARDAELDRTVALKTPHPGRLGPLDEEKFLREAPAGAQLNHPYIVSVHEVGRDGDTLYIASDFVRGVSLASWLTARRPTPREAARLCLFVAEALEHAHQAGVVHRDLKPSNIMIDADERPHLMDFGLAKRAAGEITLTTDGMVLGTPGYMPPEQARGEGHHADGRSDIYSVGVILFELLTGELPFRGNTEMVFYQILHDPAPSPRKLDHRVPRDLETITLKCLEKDPRSRFQSASELASELQRFLDGTPLRSRPVGIAGRCWRWCRRKPGQASLLASSGMLALLLFLALSLLWLQAERSRRGAKEALHAFHRMAAAGIPFIAKDDRLFSRAEAGLRRTLEHYESQSGRWPRGDGNARVEQARVHNTLGAAYRIRGEYSRSLLHHRQAVGEAEALVASRPQAENVILLATCRMSLANTLREEATAAGHANYDRAIDLLDSARSLLQRHRATPTGQDTLQAVEVNLALTLNYRSWVKATSEDPAVRDGRQALADAKRAIELVPGDFRFCDTLAAAFAEVGEYGQAVRIQQQAISLSDDAGVGVDTRRQLDQRLRQYQNERPHRE